MEDSRRQMWSRFDLLGSHGGEQSYITRFCAEGASWVHFSRFWRVFYGTWCHSACCPTSHILHVNGARQMRTSREELFLHIQPMKLLCTTVLFATHVTISCQLMCWASWVNPEWSGEAADGLECTCHLPVGIKKGSEPTRREVQGLQVLHCSSPLVSQCSCWQQSWVYLNLGV